MGAKSSNLYVTDWEKADGHLQHYQTLDHMSPTQQHETWILSHDQNRRDYQISRQQPDKDNLQYSIKTVHHTAFWFDLYRTGEPILQVRGHPWGSTWSIYSYRIPSFTGQAPADVTDESHPPVYLKARIQRNWKQDRAQVRLCQAGTAHSTAPPTPSAAPMTWSDPILMYVNTDVFHARGHTYLPNEDERTVEKNHGHLIVSDMEQADDHKSTTLEVARGCDVSMHIILAVIANTIHSNTNPYLAHAYAQDDGYFVPVPPVGFMF